MNNELKKMVAINTILQVRIAIIIEKNKGMIVNEDIINDILLDIENADIGDRADEEYQKEKDEDAMSK